MSKRPYWPMIWLAFFVSPPGMPGGAAEPAADSPAAQACRHLPSEDFSAVQDAPTQVFESKITAAVGSVPAYCNVRGYITPNIGFELKLPTESWNGKLLHMGCGGLCGVLFSSYSGNPGHDCDQGLRKGYACIASNQGHQSTMVDGKWAYNNLQAQVDYAFRATHVATLAGKAITERYYAKAPRKSYFWGCSGGGRQGLVAAQRFPWDFDGMVVVAPGINLSGVLMSFLWNARVTTTNGEPLFSTADTEWLQKAVVSKCDRDDGVKDGVIGNPLACKVDFAAWACKGGKTSSCLSAAQMQALAKIYEGPRNSGGEKIHAGGLLPGLELGIPTSPEHWAEDFFKYMGFMPAPGPAWKAADFDFDRDYERLALTQALLEDANPDLRKFKAAGGKLILAHGWTDPTPVPLNTIDYYEMVERTMGGRAATQDFLRLFMVPGMNHCSFGAGAYAIDYLSYLEAWSEKGQAPAALTGAHIKEGYSGWDFELPAAPDNVAFTRPVYPYPQRAVYKGRGDPNEASSFDAVNP